MSDGRETGDVDAVDERRLTIAKPTSDRAETPVGGATRAPPEGGATIAPSAPTEREATDTTAAMTTTPHGKRSYHCQHCAYVTDRKNNLKRHVITMHERCSKALECCDRVFINKASLREHVLASHKHGYDCALCGRNFCRKALLKRHLSVHSGQKDYVCEVCGYATSHKSNLDRHKRRHLPRELRCQYFRPLSLSRRHAYFSSLSVPLRYRSLRHPCHVGQGKLAIGNPRQNRRKAENNAAAGPLAYLAGKTNYHKVGEATGPRTAENAPRRQDECGGSLQKIWNPAISDNYRYTSVTSTRPVVSNGGKLHITNGNYTAEGVSGRHNSVSLKSPLHQRRDESRRNADTALGQSTAPWHACAQPEQSVAQVLVAANADEHRQTGMVTFGLLPPIPNVGKSFFQAKYPEGAKVGAKSVKQAAELPGFLPPSVFRYPGDVSASFPAGLRHDALPSLSSHVTTADRKQIRLLPVLCKCSSCDLCFPDQLTLNFHRELYHPVDSGSLLRSPLTLAIGVNGAAYQYF